MSTKTRPGELIRKALKGELVPLGVYEIRTDVSGLKTRYPKPAERHNNADTDEKVKKFLDQDSGATVTIPKKVFEDE